MIKRNIFIIIVFFILAGLIFPQSITVTEPDPGETWYKGQTYDIKWTSSGCTDNNIKINIFKNSVAVSNFVEQLTSSDTGSKSWTIPSSYANGNYIIRIKTSDNNCIGDSGVFQIADQQGGTLTVTEPDPGEDWEKGKSHMITWTSSGCTNNNIKINIFRNSIIQSNFVDQLTSTNSGSKSWLIPSNYTTGNYIMRIKTEDELCKGDSGVFQIINPSSPPTLQMQMQQQQFDSKPKSHIRANSMIADLFIKKAYLDTSIYGSSDPNNVHPNQHPIQCKIQIGNNGPKKSIYTNIRIERKHSGGTRDSIGTYVKQINPGEIFKTKIELSPTLMKKTGWYTLILELDADNRNCESFRTLLNNKKILKYYVKKIPKIVQCMTKIHKFHVFATYENIGEAKMPKFDARLTVKVVGTYASSFKVTREVQELSVGEKVTVLFNVANLILHSQLPPTKKCLVTFSLGFDRTNIEPVGTNSVPAPTKVSIIAQGLTKLQIIDKCNTY